MSSLNLLDLHHEQMKNPEYKKAYDALEDEFAIADALIKARSKIGLTQQDIAERLGITQPSVARIESGKNISLKTLQRYANAIGCKVQLSIVPSRRSSQPLR